MASCFETILFEMENRYLPIGSVVIDDVHAALATACEQFTLKVARDDPNYDKLFRIFEHELREQAPGAIIAIESRDPSTHPQMVPFWAWSDRSDQVANLLQNSSLDSEMKFKWPLLRDHLKLCRAVFTARNIEIAPPCLPVNGIEGYREAKHRIFLTATLADDSALVTMFDTDARSIADPITPGSASDQGDRLILAPQEINPHISEEQVKAAVANLSLRFNVVVLVPSDRRAEFWKDVANLVAKADTIEAAVERLRSGHVGIAVFVNKYDGVDLPDDACRLLVMDGLPEIYSSIEQRDANVLGSSSNMFDQQMQRIEQGMGRGVRGANDYCVIVLLGARLLQNMATPALRSQFSSLTRAQLDFSKSIADKLDNANMDDLIEVMEQVLSRDENWVKLSRGAIAGVTYGAGAVAVAAAASREAFNLAATQQYEAAAERINCAANKELHTGTRGLLRESLATYTYFIDKTRAQNILASSIKDNPRILKPIAGFTFKRIDPHSDQAKGVARYLAEIRNSNELLLRMRTIMEDLVFDPRMTGKFEQSIEELGRFLGFSSTRPERDYGNGPDNLWALAGHDFLVIECKSGSTAEEIYRSDAEQLAHSMTWFTDRYEGLAKAVPILVHPSVRLAKNASAPRGTRILTPAQLEKLKQNANDFALSLYHSSHPLQDLSEIGRRLEMSRLNAKQIIQAHSSPIKKN